MTVAVAHGAGPQPRDVGSSLTATKLPHIRGPERLRSYYGELFGWVLATGDAATRAVSEAGEYGFVDRSTAGEGTGINGGVGGVGRGEGYERRVLSHVGIPDVEAALKAAESLGGGE